MRARIVALESVGRRAFGGIGTLVAADRTEPATRDQDGIDNIKVMEKGNNIA